MMLTGAKQKRSESSNVSMSFRVWWASGLLIHLHLNILIIMSEK